MKIFRLFDLIRFSLLQILSLAFLYLFYWRIAHTIGENKFFWWRSQDFLGYLNAFRLQ
jgi:hypothetical protein